MEEHDSSCIFCKIIQKQLPSVNIYEDEEMLIFEDRSPKATAHYLCVPKKHIKDTNSLKSTDIPSIEKMVQIADVELNRLFPGSEKRFCFHRPPFTSISHLHLHCLVLPLTFIGQIVHSKSVWWSLSVEEVFEMLKNKS